MMSITKTYSFFNTPRKWVVGCRLNRLSLIFIIGIFFNACSPRQYLLNYMMGSMSGLGDMYMTEGDLELVRESLPATLKIMEAVIQQSPDNEGLLLSAVQGFTLYAYAFVQQDAERIINDDYHKSVRLRKRAHNLFKRAKGYAFKAWEVKYPGFTERYYKNPEETLKQVKREDVPLLYWTAAAWGGAISNAKSEPAVVIDLPHVGYFLERALALNGSYDNGSIHELMISYSLVRPDVGKDALEIAKKYFKQAEELAKGSKVSVFVSFAENICVLKQDREEFLSNLDRALSIDIDAYPSLRLVNVIAQDRAKRLKEQVDDLFF